MKTCCCGCSLQSGTMAIGITFLVLTTLQLIGVLGGWVYVITIARDTDVSSNDVGFSARGVHHSTPFGSTGSEERQIQNLHEVVTEVRRLVLFPLELGLGIATGVILLHLLFNSLLIHGVNNLSVGLIMAWLVFYAINNVIGGIGGIGLLVFAFTGATSFIFPGLFSLAMNALMWYLWAVVLFHYRQVQEQVGGFQYRRDIDLQKVDQDEEKEKKKDEEAA